MNATMAITIGFGLTLLLLMCIKWVFGGKKKPVTEFLIGDDGTYSVSRLQAVLWAVFIIGFQVSTFILTAQYKDVPFVLVFPREVLILLSLSLGSYVVVKGITVNKMVDKGQVKRKERAEWSDIISGDNGLDFSRFQMIIWTILAIAVYSRSYYGYLESMAKEISVLNVQTGLGVFVSRFFDLSTPNSPIPNLDPTFLVLMGVSQGVYVGKKLIPTDKLDDVKSKQIQSMLDEKSGLQSRVTALDTQIAAIDAATEHGVQQKQAFQSQRDEASSKLRQIGLSIKSLQDAM